ncbi:MAG: hypothetical protein ACI39U_06025 [Candidatus Cryptobacteroides sp.]
MKKFLLWFWHLIGSSLPRFARSMRTYLGENGVAVADRKDVNDCLMDMEL